MKTRVIENVNQIYTSREMECYHLPNDIIIHIGRVQNDINGNPLYKARFFKNFESVNNKLKGHVHRCYTTKDYVLIQSYQLHETIKRLLEEIEK